MVNEKSIYMTLMQIAETGLVTQPGTFLSNDKKLLNIMPNANLSQNLKTQRRTKH